MTDMETKRVGRQSFIVARLGVLVTAGVLLAACSSAPAEVSATPTTPTVPIASATPTVRTASSTVDSGPSTPSVPTSVPIPDAANLVADISQNRVDIGPRRMNVRVTNNSAVDVEIISAEFSSGFLSEAIQPYRAGVVHPGATLAMRYILPAADCSPGAQAAPAVNIVYRTEATGSQDLSITLTPVDTYRALAGAHKTDCAVELIDSLATVSISDSVDRIERDGKPVLILHLAVTPKAQATGVLAVTELERTTLLVPAKSPTWQPEALTTESGKTVTADLEVLPARCDPHAVAEDKRGMFLGTQVTIDGEEMPLIFTEVPQAAKGAVYQYVSDYCGW